MSDTRLWHAAFVFGSNEIDPESGCPKYPAMRAEAAVYASSAEEVRTIVEHKYRDLLHYETIYMMPKGTFILTSPEEVCPN